MIAPPIRYPLPTLILVTITCVLIWSGGEWIEGTRADLAERWMRLTTSPPIPIPASTEPKILAGSIRSRLLILEDDVDYSEVPDGLPVGKVRNRSFADLYDRWPVEGSITHMRIGNRRPLGWMPTDRLLAWETRLVLVDGRFTDQSGQEITLRGGPFPVVDQNATSIEIVEWGNGGPWHSGGKSVHISVSSIPDTTWCVWLTRAEVLGLIGRDRNQAASPGFARPVAVLRAMIGLPIKDELFTNDEAELVHTLLDAAQKIPPTSKLDALTRINENWKPDATWGGVEYKAVRLVDIP